MEMYVNCKLCGKDEVITPKDVVYEWEYPTLTRFMKLKGIIWNDDFICLTCLRDISSLQIENGITVWIGKWGRYFYYMEDYKGVWVENLQGLQSR